MRRGISSAAWLAGLWAACVLGCAPALHAQQTTPQQGSSTPAQSAKPTDANPFPEDNNAVPVISPGAAAAAAAEPDAANTAAGADMPFEDTDPAKSPDESAPSQDGGFSSSVQAAEPVVSEPDKEKKKRGRGDDDEIKPMPVAGPKEDENIGAYYLERKNWKAALSRFTSAMVLDPENPDVYWGLAEAQRNMGQFAEARVNYQKVVDFDPDSKHGKEAKRLLKTPEIANAKAAPQQ